jgi:hypothetical protein
MYIIHESKLVEDDLTVGRGEIVNRNSERALEENNE